ncbi:MAG: DUF1192 domain-containing protein [Hyphomicrobiaceae bacterium]
MDWDDVRPKTQSAFTLGCPLDNMSVDELTETLNALKQEITRVEAELAAKRARAAAASDLFKS